MKNGTHKPTSLFINSNSPVTVIKNKQVSSGYLALVHSSTPIGTKKVEQDTSEYSVLIHSDSPVIVSRIGKVDQNTDGYLLLLNSDSPVTASNIQTLPYEYLLHHVKEGDRDAIQRFCKESANRLEQSGVLSCQEEVELLQNVLKRIGDGESPNDAFGWSKRSRRHI